MPICNSGRQRLRSYYCCSKLLLNMDRHLLILILILMQLLALTEVKSHGSHNIVSRRHLTSHAARNRLRRQAQVPQFGDFINDIKTQLVDVVILMDRSGYVGRPNFYKISRPLVHHALRYYTRVSPAHVKVTLATFADDFTTHFDGIATHISKCDMLGTHWYNVVMKTDTLKNVVNIQNAFTQAERIFSRSNRDAKRYLWIISASFYTLLNDYVPSSMTDAITSGRMGILVTTVSERSYTAQRKVTNSLITYTGDTISTPRALSGISSLQEVEPVSVPSRPDQYCDGLGFETLRPCAECPSGGQCPVGRSPCVCSTPHGNVYRCPKDYSFNQGCAAAKPSYCLCTWNGVYTGRGCTVRVQQCVTGACDATNVCTQSTTGSSRSYVCRRGSTSAGSAGGDPVSFLSTTVGQAAVGGGGTGSTLLGFFVLWWCCCKRRGCDICCDDY